MSSISSKKVRGNLAYQQRQKIRQNYIEKKQALRRVFEIVKVVEKAGFNLEDVDVVYKILVAAREK